jgi:hypothetical protein
VIKSRERWYLRSAVSYHVVLVGRTKLEGLGGRYEENAMTYSRAGK